MPKPFPREFRDDVVAVARRREDGVTLKQVATDFGISETCLQNWLRQADVEDGNRPGVTTSESAELRELRNKGRFWTEAEKQRLLEKQLQILRQIIPLHRELARNGQVELTTTPFYHPILPLLWDKRSARQAMPACEIHRSGNVAR